MRAIFVAGVLLGAALLLPAHANDMPPNVIVKGEYAHVSMFLDGRLLNYRPLVEYCKQETRDWATSLEASEKSKSSTPPSKAADFGRRYDISSISGGRRYVSIIRMSGADIDDVYNATEYATLLWDSKANAPIGLERFFNETVDGGPTMVRLFGEMRSGLIEKIGKDKATSFTATLQPSLGGIGWVSLAPSTASYKTSGLNFHYGVPTPGQFALKPIEVFVPWTRFKSYLSSEGRKIFGGNWGERDIWRYR